MPTWDGKGGRLAPWLVALSFVLGCGSSTEDGSGTQGGGQTVLPPGMPSFSGGAGAGSGALPPPTLSNVAGASGLAGGPPGLGGTGGVDGAAGAGLPLGGMDALAGGGAGGTDAVAAGAGASGAGGSGGGTTGGPLGPEDGDPSAPVFSIPDVACGGPSGGFGLGSPNFQMDGRDVIVTYPCNKHAGAPVTFFLNLHGTTPVAQHFYQHGYFKIHQFTESHNIIVLTPSSVVQQWGNGDNGQDLPHLMKLIDWVYSSFHGEGKLDIRAMWVGGHSWGAMYTATFACNADLQDKVKGAVLMSGTGRNPACADRISVISSAAEDDIGPVVNQGTVPMSHGCDASVESMITNNVETHWPNCDPGFAHANYFMLGKMHASSIDVEVVQRIADLIKSTRL